MLINVVTVIILIIIGNFLTGAFVLAYHFNPSDAPCKRIFFIAKTMQSIGFILMTLRDYAPDFIAVLLGNLTLIVAIMLETWALIQVKRPFIGKLKNSYLIATSAALVIFTIIYFWFNTEANRTFVFSLESALLLTGTIFVYLMDRRRTALMTIIAAIHIVLFLFLTFRAFNAYFQLFDYTIFSTHWFNQITFAALFAHMMTVNVGFILLTKQKTDAVLLEAATIDQLTQVINRKTFLDGGKKVISKAHDDKLPVTMWMLDIDNFKYINDTYGHIIGDQVLTEIASLLKQILIENQLFGRFGGDEFASIVAGLDEKTSDQMTDTACKLIAATPFTEKSLSVSVSIGVVTIIPKKDTNFDTFYRLADEALYNAKKDNKCIWRRAYSPNNLSKNPEVNHV
jgi:diguanylate cyclase (GGDEF)-like protein